MLKIMAVRSQLVTALLREALVMAVIIGMVKRRGHKHGMTKKEILSNLSLSFLLMRLVVPDVCANIEITINHTGI